jgi:hypothetical protein
MGLQEPETTGYANYAGKESKIPVKNKPQEHRSTEIMKHIYILN